jgi:sec-independent protein translocase protein TatB
MDFLGIGPMELLLIFLIIILVVGPRDIGRMARSIGRFLNRLYKSEEWQTLKEASQTLRTLPNRLAREAELEEIKEIETSLKQAREELDEEGRTLHEGMQTWTEAPSPGPSGAAPQETSPPSGSQEESAEGASQGDKGEGEPQPESPPSSGDPPSSATRAEDA